MERHLSVRRKQQMAGAREGASSDLGISTPNAAESVAMPPAMSPGVDREASAAQTQEPEIGPEGGPVSPTLAGRIGSKLGGGAPLDAPVRGTMESAFGHSFANVRIHADGESDTLSRSISASAFTLGSNIFLSRDATSAGPYGGNELLAHELTHVVQQRAVAPGGDLTVGPADDESEREASSIGATVAQAITASPAPVSRQPSTLQRAEGATEQAAPAASVGLPVQRMRARPAVGIGRAVIQREPPPAPAAAPPAPANAAPGPTPPANAPPGAYTGPITVEWWHTVPTPGTVVSTVARAPDTTYVGDQIVVTAKISGMPIPSTAGLQMMEIFAGTPPSDFKVERAWDGQDVAKWTLTPSTAGWNDIDLIIGDAQKQNQQKTTIQMTVGTDPTLFKKRCETAKSGLNDLYRKANGWFSDVFASYKSAYDTFNAALARQASADRLTTELILGVLFAGIGGAAGGAVGAAVQGALPMQEVTKATGKIVKEGLTKVQAGTVSDAAKDIAKFVARVPAGQARGGGGGAKTPADPSVAKVDPTKAGVAQGAGAVPAIDPLSWFVSIQGALSKEEGEVGSELTKAMDKADKDAITDPKTLYDWDPVEVLRTSATLDGKPLNDLGPIPEALAYERSFWETWLANYAWKVQFSSQSEPGGGHDVSHDATSNVGGKLHDEIQRVASKFGETADQWIERYGAASKAKAEEEAKVMNAGRNG